MIFTKNDQSIAMDASSHVNRLMGGDEYDQESFMALRHHEGVQAAAIALAQRQADLLLRRGAGRLVAEAVGRLHAKSRDLIEPTGVVHELEDMLGEASVLAEHVAHADRQETRFAEHYAKMRAANHYLIGWRLNDIQHRMTAVVGDEARALAEEARNLHEFLAEPWQHPANLGDISDCFAELRADPCAFDPPPGDGDSTSAGKAAVTEAA